MHLLGLFYRGACKVSKLGATSKRKGCKIDRIEWEMHVISSFLAFLLWVYAWVPTAHSLRRNPPKVSEDSVQWMGRGYSCIHSQKESMQSPAKFKTYELFCAITIQGWHSWGSTGSIFHSLSSTLTLRSRRCWPRLRNQWPWAHCGHQCEHSFAVSNKNIRVKFRSRGRCRRRTFIHKLVPNVFVHLAREPTRCSQWFQPGAKIVCSFIAVLGGLTKLMLLESNVWGRGEIGGHGT